VKEGALLVYFKSMVAGLLMYTLHEAWEVCAPHNAITRYQPLTAMATAAGIAAAAVIANAAAVTAPACIAVATAAYIAVSAVGVLHIRQSLVALFSLRRYTRALCTACTQD
jgi:hypothetical protein